MEIDYSTAPHSRQYRDEPGAFRALPIVTKAMAAYLTNVVDPQHGWLPLGGAGMTRAVQVQAGGDATRAECRRIEQAFAELLDAGYLVRCRVLGRAMGNLTVGNLTPEGPRLIPLSGWLEDGAGQWVVIADWVPAQHGLNRHDTRCWHVARRHSFPKEQPLEATAG